MFDMLEKVARQAHMTKALAEGKILPPATISQTAIGRKSGRGSR